MDTELPLRERKRRRTRALLIETGRRLFEEHGYDETTVADIAAAAEIGTRTFFAYFETKEQLLFPESDPRVTSAREALRTRTSSSETPAQVLLRALGNAMLDSEAANPMAQLRLRLMRGVPAVQARALRLQADAQRQITVELCDAFPELEPVEAAALVGGVIGATAGAFYFLGEQGDPAQHVERVRTAVAKAINQG